jgi:hypothetical protein
VIIPRVPGWFVRNLFGEERHDEGGEDLLLLHEDVELGGHGDGDGQ